jgi:hypothetical protein
VERGSRHGIETSGSLIRGHLPSLGNIGTNCSDQKDGKIGVKGLARCCGGVEDKEMNDVMDGNAQMFNIGWMKNG